MVLNAVFNSCIVILSEPINAFLEILLTILCICTLFFQSHWLLSYTRIPTVETMAISARAVRPFAMTIINPGKENGRIGDRTSEPLFSNCNTNEQSIDLSK